MNQPRKKRISFVLLLGLLAGSLAFYPATPSAQLDRQEESTPVTLFLSYIPSVQFAPLYVAAERGYFADEGIDISFEHSFDELDGVDRLAINDLQFGIISGEQVILGRGAEKPLVYVMEWYHRFPVGVVVPADSDIETPADLEGKTVGLPGFFGASYIGLRALLATAGLGEFDVLLTPIGFTAPEVMCARDVEAAAVYIANEPLTIAKDCYEVRVIEISDYANLVSNGLVTNEETLEESPELVAAMIRAILHGVADTIEDPDAAFDLSVSTYVSDLPEDQYETQQQVLLNSVELWRSDQPGMTAPDAWELTQEILVDAELMEAPLDDLAAAYTNEFVPEQASAQE